MSMLEPEEITDPESGGEREDPNPKAKRKKTNYKCRYNENWEKIYPWIKRSDHGDRHFFCISCNVHLLGGIAAVKKHEDTSKHQKKAGAVKMHVPVTNLIRNTSTLEKKTKEIELRVTAFLVEHNISFNCCDHLTELIKQVAKEPLAVKDMSLKRTKCTAVVKNVLGLSSFTSLADKLRNTHFSLIIDESTDNSSVKLLALVIRTVTDFNVNDEFLTLLPVADATANGIYSTIKGFFLSNNIPYQTYMIGFAADGANSMMGAHHSVQSLFKHDLPNLYVFKCICHSLALCASYACLKLPRTPEDLVRDIHSYFQNSYKRLTEYQQFQAFANAKPHKLLYQSQTRWLSLVSVVKRTLEQYDALLLYFRNEYMLDKVQASETTYNRLNDPINKCYLLFLEYILPYLTDLNLEFQSESPKVHLLYYKMESVCTVILENYLNMDYLRTVHFENVEYKNPRHFKKLEDIILPPKVVAEFNVPNKYTINQQQEFRKRVLEFYKESVSQIVARFPFKSDFIQSLKRLSFLCPQNVQSTVSLAHVAACFPYFVEDVNELERQWRLFRQSCKDIDANTDMLQFWKTALSVKKGDDTLAFPVLKNFITKLLCLPHSSASVERIFSQINLNKTKIRNKLGTDTLSGVLHTKRLLGDEKCFNFNISNELMKKFKGDIYSIPNT